jgi:hypothetical protein
MLLAVSTGHVPFQKVILAKRYTTCLIHRSKTLFVAWASRLPEIRPSS